jgi:hypothetical protein
LVSHIRQNIDLEKFAVRQKTDQTRGCPDDELERPEFFHGLDQLKANSTIQDIWPVILSDDNLQYIT